MRKQTRYQSARIRTLRNFIAESNSEISRLKEIGLTMDALSFEYMENLSHIKTHEGRIQSALNQIKYLQG